MELKGTFWSVTKFPKNEFAGIYLKLKVQGTPNDDLAKRQIFSWGGQKNYVPN